MTTAVRQRSLKVIGEEPVILEPFLLNYVGCRRAEACIITSGMGTKEAP
jgi:hypothetical protein